MWGGMLCGGLRRMGGVDTADRSASDDTDVLGECVSVVIGGGVGRRS